MVFWLQESCYTAGALHESRSEWTWYTVYCTLVQPHSSSSIWNEEFYCFVKLRTSVAKQNKPLKPSSRFSKVIPGIKTIHTAIICCAYRFIRDFHSRSSAYIWFILCYTNPLHVLLHHICERPLFSSSFPPPLKFYSLTFLSLCPSPPLHVPKPSQCCLSNLASKMLELNCPSDVWILSILATLNENLSTLSSAFSSLTFCLLVSVTFPKP